MSPLATDRQIKNNLDEFITISKRVWDSNRLGKTFNNPQLLSKTLVIGHPKRSMLGHFPSLLTLLPNQRQQTMAGQRSVRCDDTIADAVLDRVVHTAHRIELKGESMRKKK